MSIPPHGHSAPDDQSLNEIPGFTVLGFSVRTTNEEEQPGKEGRIGPLWERFLQDGEKSIPGVLEPQAIYSVYKNYESDERGAYDLVLGKIVNPAQEPPAGMTMAVIPTAQYRIFPVRESSSDAIREAWQAVYRYFMENPNERRAFTADFERHSRYGTALYIAVLSIPR